MNSNEIEFLPKRFLEKRSRNNVQISRVLLLVIAIGGMVVIALYQMASLHSVNTQLAALEDQHSRVAELMQEVERKRQEVAQLRNHAHLLTFLKYPYPTSQAIAAITNPLPAEITITRIQLTHEQVATSATKPASEKSSKSKPQGPPMQVDLKQLIDEARSRRCTIELEGTTEDTSSLYTFLASLHQAEIIESAKIESIDPQTRADGSEFSNFTAHVKIKDGHLKSFVHLVSHLRSHSLSAKVIR